MPRDGSMTLSDIETPPCRSYALLADAETATTSLS